MASVDNMSWILKIPLESSNFELGLDLGMQSSAAAVGLTIRSPTTLLDIEPNKSGYAPTEQVGDLQIKYVLTLGVVFLVRAGTDLQPACLQQALVSEHGHVSHKMLGKPTCCLLCSPLHAFVRGTGVFVLATLPHLERRIGSQNDVHYSRVLLPGQHHYPHSHSVGARISQAPDDDVQDFRPNPAVASLPAKRHQL